MFTSSTFSCCIPVFFFKCSNLIFYDFLDICINGQCNIITILGIDYCLLKITVGIQITIFSSVGSIQNTVIGIFHSIHSQITAGSKSYYRTG